MTGRAFVRQDRLDVFFESHRVLAIQRDNRDRLYLGRLARRLIRPAQSGKTKKRSKKRQRKTHWRFSELSVVSCPWSVVKDRAPSTRHIPERQLTTDN